MILLCLALLPYFYLGVGKLEYLHDSFDETLSHILRLMLDYCCQVFKSKQVKRYASLD